MNRNILILGGTGAIGSYLTEIISREDHVFITSRKEHHSDNPHITYIQINAKDKNSIIKILNSKIVEDRFDAIIDFMVYSLEELEERVDLLLGATNQYFFISSARVYSDMETPIKEDSPRLLDVSKDEKYLSTNEYALIKAKQENIFYEKIQRGVVNWTIVRPSLTYGDQRLQLGVLEKENWLYRCLKGRPIVFSEDLMEHYYSFCSGEDVAKGIASLIGREEALGTSFNIVQSKSYQWKDILKLYLDSIEEYYGYRPDVFMTKTSTNLLFESRKYQVIYARYYDRFFDNSKIAKFVNVEDFLPVEIGLKDSLKKCLQKPKFNNIPWDLEAVNDRLSKSWTPLNEIKGVKQKITYLIFRLNFGWIIRMVPRL